MLKGGEADNQSSIDFIGGIANIGEMMPGLSLFPLTAEVNDRGNLIIGGCNTVELADKFGTGTPLPSVIIHPFIVPPQPGADPDYGTALRYHC